MHRGGMSTTSNTRTSRPPIDADLRTTEHTPTEVRSRSPWHRVTVAGLITLCATLTIIQVVNSTVIPAVVVFTVILGALALAIGHRAGNRTLLAAAAASVVLVVANIPVAIGDLRHPESSAGFVPTATAIVAGLTVAVSGILAATRRAPRAAIPTAIAAVIAVAVCATTSGIASLSTTDDQRRAGDIVIDVRDVAYSDVTIPSGANVLFIDNHDLIRHTLLIEETGTNVEIPGGTARRVRVELAPGVYRYICDVAGHDRMRGTITVTDDSVETGP